MTVPLQVAPAEVAVRVAAFLQAGVQAGGHCLVVAVPEHTMALKAQLALLPVAWCDAADTLAKFVVDGWPDEGAFEDSVGRLLRVATSQNSTYVYSEMAAILCMQGRDRAAVRVEQLWKGTVATLPPKKFHQYPCRIFSSEADHLRYRDEAGQTAGPPRQAGAWRVPLRR